MSSCPGQKLAGGLRVASPFPLCQPAGEPSRGKMRSSCVLLTALVALAAYYVYIPLPGSVSDPWKLMLLDATFRGAQQVSNLIHYLGLSHHLLALNFIIVSFGKKSAWSSAQVKVTDTDFDGVEVRVFEGPPKPEEPLKRSVVYIHGGGWALASASKFWSLSDEIRYYDELCTAMAEELNAVIVSIEYRLVPKVYFPEQIHDVVRATKYFLKPEVLQKYMVDPGRICISGDSAGGNLAAALGQQFTQDASLKNKLKLQALIYPVLQALDFNTPSYQQNVNTPILPRYVMVKYWVDYFKGNYDFVQAMIINNHTSLDVEEAAALRARLNWTSLLPASFTKNYKPVVQTTGNARIVQELPQLLDARSAPLIADQAVLQLLPKTYILTCEHDVLRDDGIMYAKRLESAGVEVTLDHFEDGFHGCMIFTSWPTNFSVGIRTRNSYIKWLDQNL
ncbi:PREDICTED: neutral cholesterol ester hydrolase 1 isoform X1 [Colobus angolensis palliatus]|uniref:Neutral cholesterol ester hydrolase 1 n=1 Tax=Colobus angolensis palliatus TaxID=336983 RepID=A0A2K5K2Z0_COLAP|nr:PREDICTED: neutral cholesterol ester hydrolase 1 isoform X1 [Colobus angolensis palliatus]